MPLPPRTLIADRGDAGRRLDLVLRRHLSDVTRATRTRVQTWIEDGRIAVNGTVVRRTSSRVAAADELTVMLPDETARAEVLPEAGPLDTLFEDDHLLIVNKAAGLVSHPTFRHPSGSLLNVILHHARTWGSAQRPSLVGRLDRLTSGIVIVAKTRTAHARLQGTLASHQSEKAYLAIVYGPVAPLRGTVDLRLRRDPQDRRRVIATPDDGLQSTTLFECLDRAEVDGCSVAAMRCRILTGRMHQVRVHMAARGWPLVGDPKYGEPQWQRCENTVRQEHLRTFPRQALHAWRVSFIHPFTRALIDVEAPVPADMRELMSACGLALVGPRLSDPAASTSG